ncbi:Response regulator receiver domain-containing protein [Oryzisolibacter propanilivorax]|uniref:Response regulator receiver domain-containing protein n=1 Tax=Oryzisolibacter propanilivorax TaxID=1527607 RepID=A0A1G9S0G6_9BURK|nr:response regulator [Oryzisolibacter propanilivorax]SDM28904.1 Response regulator receiver domain-containing protein [Oryzisolibacter propanilivorax]
MRILYVEDNPELRDTIAMLMEGPGRSVVACASAEQALEHDARGEPFDLVVTDVSLPGMSGTELCRSLLQDDAERRVVLCSGYALEGSAAAHGARVRLLHKPFDIDELETLLDTIQAEVQAANAAGVA